VIESDGRIPRLDVDVDVGNGVIELVGVIPDEREHDALLALVESAAGSRRVVDHLIISVQFGSKLNRRRVARGGR
jgi:osmotically-inducible protein OsmY